MDTDGDPDCLDYIWLRGAVRVVDARLAFDRPDLADPDALPERPPRHQRASRDRVGRDAGPRPHAPARPSRRLAPRPGEQHRGDDGRARDPRLRRPRVRRPALVRRRARRPPRRDARARAGTPGPRRRAARGRARGARRPDARRRPGGRARRAFLDVELKGDARPGRRGGPGRRRAAPELRDAVVSSFEPATLERVARPGAGVAVLAQQPRRSTRDVVATATALGCRGISVRCERHRRGTMATARGGRARGRRLDGPPAGDLRPAGAARGRRGLRGGRGARRLTTAHGTRRDGSRPTPTAYPRSRARTEESDMTERADLVVVGAGTVGGWASVFAEAGGVGPGRRRSSAGWPGWARRHGPRASSARRAGRRRRSRSAAGRSTSTAASRRRYGTDSGFRELGYLILAVTDEDERAGRERVAMQQANGLDVRWLDAAEAAGDRRDPVAERPSRRELPRRPTAHIDPPRNVRAYSLAMQAAGVELRERTAFTRPPHDADPTAATRHRRRDDRGPDRDRSRAADRRPVAARGRRGWPALRIPAGAARHTVAVLEPHEAFAVERAADGLRHRRRPVLAARGGRAAVRLERPGRRAGRGARDRLGVLRADARAAGRLRAGHAGPRSAPDLGGDDRLHARPPADPRPGARRPAGRRSRA